MESAYRRISTQEEKEVEERKCGGEKRVAGCRVPTEGSWRIGEVEELENKKEER